MNSKSKHNRLGKGFVILLGLCWLFSATQGNANPVVFVHGYNPFGSPSEGNIWDNMIRLMKEEGGWNASELLQMRYYTPWMGGVSTWTPIEDVAEIVGQDIQEFYGDNKNTPVDVVTHSMGGVVIRTALANNNLPSGVIRKFVPIAAPHYGQNLAPTVQSSQMKYGSRFLWDLAAAWQFNGKSIPDSQVLCIAGIANNDSHGWDGLVHYWSAALASAPTRYVNRSHIDNVLGVPFVPGVHGECDCRGPDNNENGDPRDAVYLLVKNFLSNGTILDQSDAAFVAGGGLATPNAPNGVVFLQVVDKDTTSIAYAGDIVNSTDPGQGVGLWRIHGDVGNTYGHGDANLIGVELLGANRDDQGLLPKMYTLTVNASKGSTYPSFKKAGITVTAGRTTVVRFSPVTALDFVFCIDSTGSMRDDIDKVKADAASIINDITSSVSDYRIAVVDYRDFGDLYLYNDRIPFTKNAGDVVNAINAIAVDGGGDWQEAVYSALAHSINGSTFGGWRKNAARVILLMADAPPHDPELNTGYTEASIIALAKKGGVVFAETKGAEEEESGLISLWPLLVGGDETTRGSFEALAGGTGGAVYEAGGAADVVEAMKELIKGVTGGGGYIILDVTPDVTTTFDSWTLDRSTGAMIANITIRNDSGKGGIPLEKAFWYAIQENSNIRLVTVSGTTNGLTYFDVTDQVEALLPTIGNGDLKLDSGESVTFTVPIFTRDRSIPAGHIYGIWADPPVGGAKRHAFDANGDGILDDFEILGAVDAWKAGTMDDFGLLDAVELWRAGGYSWDETNGKFVPAK